MGLKRGWMVQKVNRWKNYHTFSRHIGLPLVNQQGKHPYGSEAVISLETGFPMLKTSLFTPNSNNNLLKRSLDLIKERRKNAMVQLAYYQQKFKQGYDLSVRLRLLAPGD